MAEFLTQQSYSDEAKLVALARELAMDILPLEVICNNLKIDPNQLQTILKLPRFQAMLSEQSTVWGSALNTAERVKVKALASLELWLEELHERLHDPKETLSSKIEGGKLLAKIAGAGVEKAEVTGLGERFQLTINIGNTPAHEISVTPKVIEGVVE